MDDYHNPTFTGSTGGCPREPWHDLHCKIDGPAAYDILTNFEDVGDDNPEAWHTQIFRSIDSTSVEGFPKEPKDALEKNLICGKNVLIGMSIHTAYVKIALKIAEKIKANERFAVYIIIPMWPEGDPTGAATQRILFWQHKTMEMMYKTIYNTLVEVGLEAVFSPQDYLNFFCLRNREAVDMHETHPSASNRKPLPMKIPKQHTNFCNNTICSPATSNN
ncbi:hypothetical protein KIW84_013568 [Lathyrus oleraceus]|uniref:Uncharacterized protein n=1 Tax=Pisum sativum TaxID=3888 RepID=A0A9D5BKE0_PEA|nr:hypothetical protein KIW84_013568 [Pisum sativum]